ncbi:TPA: aminoacyl-tRNA hydrolase [Candidatus Gracilibacteria bacterium]|nr:aminoacyl-tRNA hydrolase [Candidatus Peregrinibacteria bacterium]HIQ56789.1 aminoacyl-tRNA hydrolase [Candidatus Gracilibacteria bacterium]
MKIYCFLGNIGKEYEKTRHNVGFLCGDFLREKFNFSQWKKEKKFFGEISEGILNGEKTIFLKPHTFMNASGKSLLALYQFYKTEISDICVIFDDKDMILEKIRHRKKGSSGGQNGIKNIISVFGTDEISRIKIGVGNEKQAYFKDTADFVLSNFSSDEISFLQTEIFPKVLDIVTT